MKFKAWIESYGKSRLANDLGVNRSLVSKWLLAERQPGLDLASHIIKLSNGALTINDLMIHGRQPENGDNAHVFKP